MCTVHRASPWDKFKFNPQTYTQANTLHRGTRGGGGRGCWWNPTPWVFVMLQYFEKFSPLVENLWCALQLWGVINVKMYFSFCAGVPVPCSSCHFTLVVSVSQKVHSTALNKCISQNCTLDFEFYEDRMVRFRRIWWLKFCRIHETKFDCIQLTELPNRLVSGFA